MQSIPKKNRQPNQQLRRILLLLLAGLALAAVLLITRTLEDPPTPAQTAPADSSVSLYAYTPEDVSAITIRRGSETPWTAVQTAQHQLQIGGEDGFTLTEAESAVLLMAASRITASDVLTENPADYAGHLADFGLESPRYEAWITYADGREIHLRVGDASPDGAWRYMLLSGDDRLFAFSRGSVESLFVNKDTLRTVTQPVLHKGRIDRITLTGSEGMQAQWTLTTDVTAMDVGDHWQITLPFVYPADAAAMDSLLSNIANLRLGAYVCDATPEALMHYGFNAPRLTIDIHMAAATIGSINSEGVYATADWPESTLTFVIGGEKSDMVDYVLCNGQIFIASRYTMGIFMNYDVTGTMTRYLLPTALGNLASLTIEERGVHTEYAITRVEQVAANNELVYDEEGNVRYDVQVTCNGKPVDYTTFEAAYSALLPVTVSGLLPERADTAPHTVYTFTDVDGTVHIVAFSTFDALHDAVTVDGHQAFYLIKGGFKLNMH